MGWFRRLCLFILGLAGILALVALSLPWVGPVTAEAASLLTIPAYFYAVEVCVAITGLSLVGFLLASIFWPRNPKAVIISRGKGGDVTVTRSAIASQVSHIIEEDGTCEASNVRVRARKRGSIRISVRVIPQFSVNIVEKGAELHERLDEGLARICGDKVQRVDLQFADPRVMAVEDGDYEDTEADDMGFEVHGVTSSEEGITVPISSLSPIAEETEDAPTENEEA